MMKLIVRKAPVVQTKWGERCYKHVAWSSPFLMHLNFGNKGGRTVYGEPRKEEQLIPISRQYRNSIFKSDPKFLVLETKNKVTVWAKPHKQKLGKQDRNVISLTITRKGPDCDFYLGPDEDSAEEKEMYRQAYDEDSAVWRLVDARIPFKRVSQYTDGDTSMWFSFARKFTRQKQVKMIKGILGRAVREGTIVGFEVHASLAYTGSPQSLMCLQSYQGYLP
jgi:hypothetical protein